MALDNVFILDISRIGPEPEINTLIGDIHTIIEIYYKMSLQVPISEEDKKLLERFSLKNFLEA